jgi:ParB family transcriptional regulator, chromosome partitioning protein
VLKNSKKPGALGRGLDVLLPKVSGSQTNKVAIKDLIANREQPRTNFDEAALEELAASIKTKGILQPLLVRTKGKKYEIIAGERRFRAAQMAGLEEVPVIVREFSDQETLEIALIENLQREDLNPLEEARGYKNLLEFGITQDEAAQAVGKARSTVTNSLRLLSLSQNAQQALEEGTISAGHARAILGIQEQQRDWALEQVLSNDLNVRQTEALKKTSENTVGNGASATAIAAKPRIHRQLELELSRYSGTKVRIVGENKGKLELYYHSPEDLNRILQMLGYEV